MSRITTHVLDTVLGKPAAGIRVRLEAMEGGGWIEVSVEDKPGQRLRDVPGDWIDVSSSITDADGRCRDLAEVASEGTYRLTFETGKYFAREGRSSIYPEISIVFFCTGEAHYHLPLLLSDNSYTTYRGS
ncbi:MAG: hydroxyisourate hydrolase [Terracidiphilus sp.]